MELATPPCAPPAEAPSEKPPEAPPRLDVLVTSVASDAHTWNLIYLQLLLEESGHRVTNLGACVPDQLMVDECRTRRPDLIVISTVNGHGSNDGRRVVRRLRDCAELRTTPIVIGGKLGITGGEHDGHMDELVEAGFNAVFEDSAGIVGFRDFVRALPAGAAR
ncbi:cobalamin B12-binding domain-containing protein [Streptomyces sp. NPDC048567]|uniref:cobalamin B12-binding domain-containing protein n=1 Tax=Streptomyces sp. NPDC048567 TaxID=3365570 RepID=UPI00371F7B5F